MCIRDSHYVRNTDKSLGRMFAVHLKHATYTHKLGASDKDIFFTSQFRTYIHKFTLAYVHTHTHLSLIHI